MIVGIDPVSRRHVLMEPDRSTIGEAVDIPVHSLIRGGTKKRELRPPLPRICFTHCHYKSTNHYLTPIPQPP
jgi:hypothetical protein